MATCINLSFAVLAVLFCRSFLLSSSPSDGDPNRKRYARGSLLLRVADKMQEDN